MTNDFKIMVLSTGFNVFLLTESKLNGETTFTQKVIKWLRS